MQSLKENFLALYDFTGRVIIITGAAGAIGSEAARQLATLGANVALTDINEYYCPLKIF